MIVPIDRQKNVADGAEDFREQIGFDPAAARAANGVGYTMMTGANFTTSSDVQVLLSTAISTDYWHFGSMVYEPAKNRFHWVYRNATVHTATESQIMYMFSDDGGATLWSYDGDGEVVSGPSAILASPSGRDYRDVCAGIAPNGDIFVVFTDLGISGGPTPIRMLRSKDGGKTLTEMPVVYTHPNTGCRAYGRIKVIPGKGKNRMAFLLYRTTAPGPDVRMMVSDDMGETWSMGSAVFSGGIENETEFAMWGRVGVAVARRNGESLSVAVTQDLGATWTKLADIPDTASTLERVRFNLVHILLP